VATFKVIIEQVDWWLLLMGSEGEQAPDGLYRADISSVQSELDLVIAILHSEGSTIHALVDILGEILDGVDPASDFDVDMRVVLLSKVGIVGNHPPIENSTSSATARILHGIRST
jgi:hypothetical protein